MRQIDKYIVHYQGMKLQNLQLSATILMKENSHNIRSAGYQFYFFQLLIFKTKVLFLHVELHVAGSGIPEFYNESKQPLRTPKTWGACWDATTCLQNCVAT